MEVIAIRMIYTLTVTAVSGAYLEEECIRVLEIDDSATLEDLHFAIQQAVSFDNDHLYDFYAGRHYRNRQIRYSDDEDWETRESRFSRLKLSAVYPLKRLKLYYWFDFGDDWIFEIRKARMVKPAESGRSYPRVIESHGPNPEQYPSWD